MDFFWTWNGLGVALHSKVTFPVVTAVFPVLAGTKVLALPYSCHMMHLSS